MTPTLHLFIIHTQGLVTRQPRLHGNVQTLREIAQRCGYMFKSIMVLTPDPVDIQARMPEFNERVKYESVGDADFDKAIAQISVEALSNREKHVEAWRRVLRAAETSTNERDLYMVVEDDFIILPEGGETFREFLQARPDAGDIAILGIAGLDAKWANAPLTFLPTRETYRLLPCKESYLIRPSLCQKWVAAFETGKIIFGMRTALSHQLSVDTDVQSVYPSKRMLLDGSKVGVCPSSVHPNNMLIFNREYMELWRIYNNPQGVMDVTAATQVYKQVVHMNCPDIMHLYGVILFKAGAKDQAEEILTEAIEHMQKQQGLLGSRSDLLNNLINMYEFLQKDI